MSVGCSDGGQDFANVPFCLCLVCSAICELKSQRHRTPLTVPITSTVTLCIKRCVYGEMSDAKCEVHKGDSALSEVHQGRESGPQVGSD